LVSSHARKQETCTNPINPRTKLVLVKGGQLSTLFGAADILGAGGALNATKS